MFLIPRCFLSPGLCNFLILSRRLAVAKISQRNQYVSVPTSDPYGRWLSLQWWGVVRARPVSIIQLPSPDHAANRVIHCDKNYPVQESHWHHLPQPASSVLASSSVLFVPCVLQYGQFIILDSPKDWTHPPQTNFPQQGKYASVSNFANMSFASA